MASDSVAENESAATPAETMEVENPQSTAEDKDEVPNGSSKEKREREEGQEDENSGISKKQKAECGAEEVKLEKLDENKDEGGEGAVAEKGKTEDDKKTGPVTIGPKTFQTSVEMFDYFLKLLHNWSPNLSFNKYEALMLTDLIKKGHPEPETKIGSGVESFQIKNHPHWKSRCFFVVRTDKSEVDFSFRKCVDHILPLPENMKGKPDVSKALGGGGHGRRGGGHGGGRGRGGWSRR